MTETQAVLETPPIEGQSERDAGHEGQGVGLLKDLAELPGATLIDEASLARMLKRHPVSLKRAVTRGELPQPTRLLGAPVWTVGAILGHVERRLAAAQAAREKDLARVARLGAGAANVR